jgi:two-component system response regulator
VAAAETARAFRRARLANPIKIVRHGEAGLNYLFGSGRYARRKQVRPQLILLVLDLPRNVGVGVPATRHGRRSARATFLVVVLTVSRRPSFTSGV